MQGIQEDYEVVQFVPASLAARAAEATTILAKKATRVTEGRGLLSQVHIEMVTVAQVDACILAQMRLSGA